MCSMAGRLMGRHFVERLVDHSLHVLNPHDLLLNLGNRLVVVVRILDVVDSHPAKRQGVWLANKHSFYTVWGG